jgi:hypothetical protein
LQAGTLLCQEWEQEAKQVEQTSAEGPPQEDALVFSADGAMVPFVGGIWAEVKTLAIGTVAVPKEEEEAVHVQKLSDGSRLTDVPGFEQATLVDMHRRGLEQATRVAAAMDGADWLQGIIDSQRADAVRILDFAHAAEYVHGIGEGVRAAGFSFPHSWREGVLHRRKHDGPERVLVHLARLSQRCGTPEVGNKWASVLARHAHMHDPTSHAAGWPIGSGMVESATNVVVEARLKGTGMRGKREDVTAMLVFRTAVCHDRWEESWQHSQEAFRNHQQQRREMLATRRRERVATCLRDRVVRIVLVSSHPQHEPTDATVSSAEAAPTPPATPKGRTEAQRQWGRRPFSPNGYRLQAECAKKGTPPFSRGSFWPGETWARRRENQKDAGRTGCRNVIRLGRN